MTAPWHADPFDPERYELREPPRFDFAWQRRDFLKALGGGLAVAVVLAREASAMHVAFDADANTEAQQRQQPGVAAYLHVGRDGTVTAFTGKVEVGQDARTSLTQAVAEELPVDPSSITVVMGDTSRVPHDAGTFGSRTTPAMAPLLRRAAAATRNWLVELAADRLGVPASELRIAGGAVVHDASAKSVPIGELADGKSLERRIDAESPLTPTAEWSVLGRSLPKVGGRALVTGAHRFPSDVTRPGMLHGKVLRAPAYGAKLAALDDAAAKAIDGVTVVRDGDFVGVVAADAATAGRAVAALRATFTPPPTPPIGDAALAMHLRTTGGGRDGGGAQGGRGGGRGGGGRGAAERGDVDAGLAAAAHRVEATFTIPYIAHAPLEPRAAVAEWSDDGRLTVWTGTSRPFGVADELVRAFRIGADKVRVIVPDTGAGYGGKHTGDAAVEAAALARAAGRPVAVRWTREEEFTWAYFRPAGVIDVRAGVDASAQLVAWDFHNFNSGGAALAPLYEVENLRCRFHTSDSPLRQGSYRALAATANHFARESTIDDLAAAVKLDPLAFRRANLKDPRLLAVLDAVAERCDWGAPLPERQAQGLACGFDKGGYVACAATVEVEGATFRVVRVVTVFECGAVVHPRNLRSQVEGGVVQGLGGALFEAITFEGGRVTNPRFSAYRVPRFRDMPVLVTVQLDRKDLPSAGAGETPIVGVAPAIRNALAVATGQRLRSLPLRLA